jgi:hypothetical protein
MANPLESVIESAHKVPPMVWVGGGVIVVGFIGYRIYSSRNATAANTGVAASQQVGVPIGSQQTDLAAVVGEVANSETNAIAAVGAQANQQQAALAQTLQQQQQIDAQSQQGFESLILGGLNQQEQNYATLQGQTESYLTSNQQSFSQAAQTFATAQSGMAGSLAALWQKLATAPAAPAQAPGPVDPTSAEINQNAQGLGIPVFDIQAFSGVYHHLPGSIPELDNFLNSVGLRDPATQKLALPV